MRAFGGHPQPRSKIPHKRHGFESDDAKGSASVHSGLEPEFSRSAQKQPYEPPCPTAGQLIRLRDSNPFRGLPWQEFFQPLRSLHLWHRQTRPVAKRVHQKNEKPALGCTRRVSQSGYSSSKHSARPCGCLPKYESPRVQLRTRSLCPSLRVRQCLFLVRVEAATVAQVHCVCHSKVEDVADSHESRMALSPALWMCDGAEDQRAVSDPINHPSLAHFRTSQFLTS